MGRCRFVQPDTVRLTISDGDWIDVKKRLSVGEKRKAEASIVADVRPDGRVTPNLEMMGGKAQVLAYLLDWSLRDAQDRPVKIETDAKRSAAIDQLDEATFKEIAD